MALVVEAGRLHLVPRRWTLFGIPMPRRLMPGGPSFEEEVGGVFRFNVEIRVPVFGLLVAYRGRLQPVEIS